MILDIPERQILVFFPNDAIPYHHRVLIRQVSGSAWVASSPDFELESLDLSEYSVRALGRDAPWPVGIGAVYGFDNPISEADLAQIRTEGNRLAEVLGAAPVGGLGTPGSADGRWRYADPGFHCFGEEVPVDIRAADARVRLEGVSGLISAPDDDDQLVWTFAQRVDERDLVEWLDSKRAGVGRDARLLESRRDPDGARATLLRRAYGDHYVSTSGASPRASVCI